MNIGKHDFICINQHKLQGFTNAEWKQQTRGRRNVIGMADGQTNRCNLHPVNKLTKANKGLGWWRQEYSKTAKIQHSIA